MTPPRSPGGAASRAKRVMDQLDAAHANAPKELLHSIAGSMASFIAEIDASSSDVAAYIEQRLAPLARFVNTDARVGQALAAIARDSRKLPPKEPR